jgi:hypothetical protein
MLSCRPMGFGGKFVFFSGFSVCQMHDGVCKNFRVSRRYIVV